MGQAAFIARRNAPHWWELLYTVAACVQALSSSPFYAGRVGGVSVDVGGCVEVVDDEGEESPGSGRDCANHEGRSCHRCVAQSVNYVVFCDQF